MFGARKSLKSRRPPVSFSDKANRVLNLILIAFLLIIVRVWHLSVIQYEKKSDEAKRPTKREVMAPAQRGTIRDRFNIPLAINKVRYQAAVYYSHLKDIPSVTWEVDTDGKKVKKLKRKEYISQLAELLAKELQLDPDRIEDMIYSKAAFYYNIPYILKEDISEEEYYRLKMLEKDWPGIHVSQVPRRHYPQGKVGSDIIGYMGAINRAEYDSIITEIHLLKDYLIMSESGEEVDLPHGLNSDEEVRQRLKDLEYHAYTVNDYVGKSGIESMFEQDMRGFHGKRIYYSDARGNFLRELPGSRSPKAGQRILLTISSELQEFAEQLLIQNEYVRELQQFGILTKGELKRPWIRGGAIVVMEPSTGDVLAMASHPRFDPNDFVPSGNQEQDKQKYSNISRWFESESYIADLWDQKRPFEREWFDLQKGKYIEEQSFLTWQGYLEAIIPPDSGVYKGLDKIASINSASKLLRAFEVLLNKVPDRDPRLLVNLLYYTDGHITHKSKITPTQRENLTTRLTQDPSYKESKKTLDAILNDVNHNYDKLLVLDLCRLHVSDDTLAHANTEFGKQTLSAHYEASSAFATLTPVIKSIAKDLFHEYHFKNWRKEREKEFLKEKRLAEKLANQYPKPYIEYLDQEETIQFQAFWQAYKGNFYQVFLTGQHSLDKEDPLVPYLEHYSVWFNEIEAGAHQAVPWYKQYMALKKGTQDWKPRQIESYLRSLRGYHDLNRPLWGRYRNLHNQKGVQLEKHLAGAFYPTYGFGYGRSQAYRQATTQGSIFKVVTAYAALAQHYKQQMEQSGRVRNLNPFEIVDLTFKSGNSSFLGYFPDEKPIPQIYKGGRLIKSLRKDIGRTDLVGALVNSSNPYFSLLAGDFLNSPEDLANAARGFSYGAKTGIDLPGEIAGRVPTDLNENRTGLYATAIGQHTLVVTPLQTAVLLSALSNDGQVLKPKIVHMKAGIDSTQSIQQTSTVVMRDIFLPKEVRDVIFKGMRGVISHVYNDGLRSLYTTYKAHPEAIEAFVDMKDTMIAKSSSAESVEQVSLDLNTGVQKLNHVWFGAIALDEKREPELVVVIYLKYGGYGKDAAPLAAQMIKKWRELKQKYK